MLRFARNIIFVEIAMIVFFVFFVICSSFKISPNTIISCIFIGMFGIILQCSLLIVSILSELSITTYIDLKRKIVLYHYITLILFSIYAILVTIMANNWSLTLLSSFIFGAIIFSRLLWEQLYIIIKLMVSNCKQ